MTTPEPEATNAPEAAPALPDFYTDPNAVLKDEGSIWRYGQKPDYSKTRKFFAETKQANHEAGSLPELVENLVKNWEIEASFKTRLSDWRTINHERYTFAMNGEPSSKAEYMLERGTYNAILPSSEYYCPEHADLAVSHKTFKRMMPTFAWEVMEVYSPPPKVAFRWRHWGYMKNDYVGINNKGDKVISKAHNGLINIQGVTVADLDDAMKVVHLETWFDPMTMFSQIAPNGVVKVNSVAASALEDDDTISSPAEGEVRETHMPDPQRSYKAEAYESESRDFGKDEGKDGGTSISESQENHKAEATESIWREDNRTEGRDGRATPPDLQENHQIEIFAPESVDGDTKGEWPQTELCDDGKSEKLPVVELREVGHEVSEVELQESGETKGPTPDLHEGRLDSKDQSVQNSDTGMADGPNTLNPSHMMREDQGPHTKESKEKVYSTVSEGGLEIESNGIEIPSGGAALSAASECPFLNMTR